MKKLINILPQFKRKVIMKIAQLNKLIKGTKVLWLK